jgi:hypothetical protein
MKKIVLFSTLLLLTFSLSACSKDPDQNSKPEKVANQTTKTLGEYQKAEWLSPLLSTKWADIKIEEGLYSYEFQASDEVQKKLSYTKDSTGTYQGQMLISFNNRQDSYIANIPKSFASHIEQLNFSLEPDNIINPDPIVEFKNIDGEIVIESLENKTEAEITNSMETQVIDSEAKRCLELPSNDGLSCMLSLIHKYKGNDYIKEEISTLKLNELLGASAQAVYQSDLSVCRHVESADEKTRCYEYAYQFLLQNCDAFDDQENRDCIRDLSDQLPSLKEKRLFCGFIKNEAMRAECEGTADLNVCDEIQDMEARDMCRLNINRTQNDLESCSKLEDKNMQEACIAVIGADRVDQNICNKVKDEYVKGQCLTKIAMVSNEKSICPKIEDDKSQDICNGYFIMKGQVNEAMCQETHELFLKEMCQMVLAINNKDTFKCANPDVVSYDNQPICYLGTAVKHNDAELCAKIDITQGEFEEDRKIKEQMRDACYAQIALNTKDESLCDNIIDSEREKECKDEFSKPVAEDEPSDEEKLAEYPPMPDWFDCPINEGTKLYTWANNQQSGYRWVDPNYANRYRGPYLVWWGEGFDYPYQFTCYNAEGEKHGPFKEWAQGKEFLIKEGSYKNDKLDGEVRLYSKEIMRDLSTYQDGKKNGYTEVYCDRDEKKCNRGDLRMIGNYQNGQKHGFWKTYEFGQFVFKQEFVNGEVTRDESGMSLKYYSE